MLLRNCDRRSVIRDVRACPPPDVPATRFSFYILCMSRRRIRVAVAVAVGTVATAFQYAEQIRTHGRHSDFGVTWFGARSLLSGTDPYPLVGARPPFDPALHLNYPATSMVAVLPLGLLPELAATLIFVGISSALLAYALSEKGWERMWMLPSAAFIVAVRMAQWSPIYSAAYLMPSLAWMLSVKPTLGFAVAVAAPSRRLIKFAAVGSMVLLAVSVAMLPAWPKEWLHTVQPNEFPPAVTWSGGQFILLALLRWRAPEARLLLAMGCIPITPAWYEALPLLLIGRTKRECQMLSLLSSVGYLLQGPLFASQEIVNIHLRRGLLLAFCYGPALLVVLRRPNVRAAARMSPLVARLTNLRGRLAR